jgi:ribosome biogenesis GTPase / thiamine phosphate phosphatase
VVGLRNSGAVRPARTYISVVLETIGFDAEVAAAFARWRTADAAAGRVVRVEDGVATVVTDSGTQRATYGGALLAELAEHPGRTPCAGDWVVLRSWPDSRVTLAHVLPRRTALVPPATGTTLVAGDAVRAALAANMDVVVVVGGAATTSYPTRLHPLVDLAVRSGATPLLLLPGPPRERPEPWRDLELLDRSPERLRARVGGRRTVALLGADPGALAALVRDLTGAHPIARRRSAQHRSGDAGTATLCTVPGGGAVLPVLFPAAMGTLRPGRFSAP